MATNVEVVDFSNIEDFFTDIDDADRRRELAMFAIMYAGMLNTMRMMSAYMGDIESGDASAHAVRLMRRLGHQCIEIEQILHGCTEKPSFADFMSSANTVFDASEGVSRIKHARKAMKEKRKEKTNR